MDTIFIVKDSRCVEVEPVMYSVAHKKSDVAQPGVWLTFYHNVPKTRLNPDGFQMQHVCMPLDEAIKLYAQLRKRLNSLATFGAEGVSREHRQAIAKEIDKR